MSIDNKYRKYFLFLCILYNNFVDNLHFLCNRSSFDNRALQPLDLSTVIYFLALKLPKSLIVKSPAPCYNQSVVAPYSGNRKEAGEWLYSYATAGVSFLAVK